VAFPSDSSMSRAYGVDNDLCVPHRSISYWALLVTGAITLLQLRRHATVNTGAAFLLLVIDAASLLLFTALRVKVSKLNVTLSDENQIVALRSISSCATRLTGAALFACFVGASIIKAVSQ
jgi:hypothetical protein